MQWDWQFTPRFRVLLHNGKQLVIAVDQAVNALVGWLLSIAGILYILPKAPGAWYADETISALCWRWELNGVCSWPRRLVDAIFWLFGDRNHCRKSYESEVNGLHLPKEQR